MYECFASPPHPMCWYVCTIYIPSALRSWKRASDTLQQAGVKSHQPPCGCWASNPVPLQGQSVLLTMESSLQPLEACFLRQGLPSGLVAVFYARLVLCFYKIRKRGGRRGEVEPAFTEFCCHGGPSSHAQSRALSCPAEHWVPQSNRLKKQVELHLQLQAALYPLRKAVIFPLCFQLPVEAVARSHHFMSLKLRLTFFSVNLGRVLITACSNPLHIHSWLLNDNDIWHQCDLDSFHF